MATKKERKEYFERLKKNVEAAITNIKDSQIGEPQKWKMIDELLDKLKEIEKLILENTDY